MDTGSSSRGEPNPSPLAPGVTLPVDTTGRLMEPLSGRGQASGMQQGQRRQEGDEYGSRTFGEHPTSTLSPHTRPWNIDEGLQDGRQVSGDRYQLSRPSDRSFPSVYPPSHAGRHPVYGERSRDYAPSDIPSYGHTAMPYSESSQGVHGPATGPPPHESGPYHALGGQMTGATHVGSYAPFSASYDVHSRTAHDGVIPAAQVRPGSVPWSFSYPPPGGHVRGYPSDVYPSHRPVESALPSIPPPFRGPHDGYDHAPYGRESLAYTSSLSPVEPSAVPLPGMDSKTRRTSMESGTATRRTATAGSRLGLDPVAKQERRREQNRLAQRAFRARAKMREQEKTNDNPE